MDQGKQSSTLKSYMSTLKCIIRTEGFIIDDDKIMLRTLVRACTIENDTVYARFPIRTGLLDILLFELEWMFGGPHNTQPFLELLYKAVLLLAYHGLFRIGELAAGDHIIKAKDIHIGQNKNKILVILYSSKTQSKESRPQKVKITQLHPGNKTTFFRTLRNYAIARGNYKQQDEQFFIYADHSPVTQNNCDKY